MKFCSKCGKEMPGSASICPHCGFLHRSTNHPRDEGNAEHPGYFGTKEAARQLKVSIGTLSRRCRQGKFRVPNRMLRVARGESRLNILKKR